MKMKKNGVVVCSVLTLSLGLFSVSCLAQSTVKNEDAPIPTKQISVEGNTGNNERVMVSSDDDKEEGENIQTKTQTMEHASVEGSMSDSVGMNQNNGNGIEGNEEKNQGGEILEENQREEKRVNVSENSQKNQNQEKVKENNGEERRSRVATAVHEMLEVADRNIEIGQQVRLIAQNQNQEQNEMEGSLQVAHERNNIVKFLIGPNYKELNKVEDRLKNNKNRLNELRELRNKLDNDVDVDILTSQIEVMEQVGAELENEVDEAKGGVSLFGWLFKWMSK